MSLVRVYVDVSCDCRRWRWIRRPFVEGILAGECVYPLTHAMTVDGGVRWAYNWLTMFRHFLVGSMSRPVIVGHFR